MKARPPKPGARSSSAKKPAVARGRPTETRKAATRATSTSKVAAKKAAPAHRIPKAAQAASAGKASKASPARSAKAPVALVGADCTIEHAPALHAQLLTMLAERVCVTLDVTAVKRCDTAGLQVLAAFVRERREVGAPFALKGVTEAFVGPATLLGLKTLFGLENEAVAA